MQKFLLFFSVVSSCFFTPVKGAMISTIEIANNHNRIKLVEMVSRVEVQKELVLYGVDSQEAIVRVDNLTDEEVSKILAQIGDLPAGGNMLEAWYKGGIAAAIIILLLLVAGILA